MGTSTGNECKQDHVQADNDRQENIVGVGDVASGAAQMEIDKEEEKRGGR